MKSIGMACAGTLVSFFLIDALWLGVIARNFYRDQLGDLMLPSPNFAVAAVFYLFFAVAIIVLAVRRGLKPDRFGRPWDVVPYSVLPRMAPTI